MLKEVDEEEEEGDYVLAVQQSVLSHNCSLRILKGIIFYIII
jgi:hypothetical protein